MSRAPDPADSLPAPVEFPSTAWSALRAGAATDESSRRRGFEHLAEAYWKPAYWFLRLSLRLDPDTARDATQAFFLHAMEKGFLEKADASRGRFRSFLRVCLRHFVADRARAESAGFRGGGSLRVPWESAEVEAGRVLAAGSEVGPERVFEVEWRKAVVDGATRRLRAGLESAGKAIRFEVFRRYDLEGEDAVRYADVACALDLSIDDVQNHLRAARRDFREAVRLEVAETVGTRADLDAELEELFAGPA